MILKFTRECSAIKSCPPDGCVSENVIAFHVVRDPINSDDNFRESIIKMPNRTPPGRPKLCDEYALSMFNSVENLRARLTNIFEANQRARKNFGDKIAVCELTTQYGKYAPPNHGGHFPFWQYISFKPHEHFTLHCDLGV